MFRSMLKMLVAVFAVLALVGPAPAAPVELWITFDTDPGGDIDWVERVGASGNFIGQLTGLNGARGMAMTTDLNHVLVTNNGAAKLVRYERDSGALLDADALNSTGGLGFAFTPIHRGSDIVIADNEGRVKRYDNAGNFLSTIVDISGGPNGASIVDMVQGPGGDLLIADADGSGGQLYRFLASGAAHPTQPVISAGIFGGSGPSLLAFGPDGKLYVGRPNTGEIETYTFDGSNYSLDSGFFTGGNFQAGMAFGPDGNLYLGQIAGGDADKVIVVGGPFHATPGEQLSIFYDLTGNSGSIRRLAWIVPEPASLALLGLGDLMMLKRHRKSA